MSIVVRIAVAAGAALALASCSTGGSDTRTSRGERPRAGPSARPLGPAPATAEYFRRAASVDLFEVRSSELALVRAQRLAVRDFARMMVTAHSGTAAQLSMAGRRLNMLPARTFEPREAVLFAELQAAADFDATYVRQQRAVHQDALRLHSAYAARGASPTLRPVAANAVPIIRRHLDMLRRL